MAKLTVGFEVPRKDGKRKVVFNLSHKGVRRRIPVDIELLPTEVAKARDGSLKVKSEQKRYEIERQLQQYEERIHKFNMEKVGIEVTADDIFSFLLRRDNVQDVDFFTFADKWLSEQEIKGKKNYNSMLNSLETFNGSRFLPFSKIDFAMLTNYSAFLKDHPRAQSLYLGAIRHIHKQAQLYYNTDDKIIISPMLFERFKVPRQRMKGQRALDIEQLKMIIAYKGTGRAALARDCFVMSFLTMGMNSADLYDKDAKLTNGKICYHRKKTRDRRADDAYIEVDVLPELEPLIKKYRGKARLFSFYNRYADEAQFNRAINIGLDKIEEDINAAIDKRKLKIQKLQDLQFYQARHTWASIARNSLDIDAYTIDKALNHINKDLKLLDVYVKRDFKGINEANRKVVEYINKNG